MERKLSVLIDALATAPAVHPRIAETYQARVASLRDAMQKSASPEIREALRALISRVEIHAGLEGVKGPRIKLIGHLAALLRAGGLDVPDLFAGSVKVDAGTRKHLDLLLVA